MGDGAGAVDNYYDFVACGCDVDIHICNDQRWDGFGMGMGKSDERGGRTDRGHTPSGFRFKDVDALCDERARIVDDLHMHGTWAQHQLGDLAVLIGVEDLR